MSGLRTLSAGGEVSYEEDSGLFYYRLRYYDPVAGRFVSRDLLGLWGDPGQRGNGQSYCSNNPVNLVDPMGLGAEPYAEVETYLDSKNGMATIIVTWYEPLTESPTTWYDPNGSTRPCTEEERRALLLKRRILRKTVVVFVAGFVKTTSYREHEDEILVRFDKNGMPLTAESTVYNGPGEREKWTKWDTRTGRPIEKGFLTEDGSYVETYAKGAKEPTGKRQEKFGPAGAREVLTTTTSEAGEIRTRTKWEGDKEVSKERWTFDRDSNLIPTESSPLPAPEIDPKPRR
ncbi:MAG: RHS repeat-associated core domain-containing protein [Planctomycetes bacterium]|nr:RHS repeat-associated core domain-containing protein [Planctomycetota bacterium]